jgi:hypothetical protein
MISSDWLYRWKCFVSNKVSSNMPDNFSPLMLRISENERIGILPPGPISNDCLFVKAKPSTSQSSFEGLTALQEPKSLQIRKGLELNKDYRGVNKEVWQIFHRIYGGGPLIVRDEEDIYSQDLSAELTVKRL